MNETLVIDGRVARGLKTQDRILRAARDLIEETGEPPKMDEIAALADVALRTCYHHFEGIDAVISLSLALKPRRQLKKVWLPA